MKKSKFIYKINNEKYIYSERPWIWAEKESKETGVVMNPEMNREGNRLTRSSLSSIYNGIFRRPFKRHPYDQDRTTLATTTNRTRWGNLMAIPAIHGNQEGIRFLSDSKKKQKELLGGGPRPKKSRKN